MPEPQHARAVRSYVIREGRLTAAQARALDEHMPRLGTTPTALARGPSEVFGRHAPLHLEIGIGNGDNLVALAGANPHNDYLGCEVHRPGIGHALLAATARGLGNLRLVHADAHDLLEALPAGALTGLYVFFPDPWPKKRHHKRRLLQPSLLELAVTRLTRAGRFYFASDHADYAAEVLSALEVSPRWVNLAGPGQWAPRPRQRVITRFEQRALEAGSMVHDIAAAPSGT